jgi:16S rRNA (adenine(1408)-N(1))-methyltransferase
MEISTGKQTIQMDYAGLMALVHKYSQVWVDIGTGDGQFVKKTALAHPDTLVIGVDACRENLQATSRASLSNALFVIANALELPGELDGLADHVTINFPWGSLLRGLLMPDPALITGLQRISRGRAQMEIRLNESALNEAGWELEDGVDQIAGVLSAAGFRVKPVVMLRSPDLKKVASSWSKRLAFSHKPRAAYLTTT